MRAMPVFFNLPTLRTGRRFGWLRLFAWGLAAALAAASTTLQQSAPSQDTPLAIPAYRAANNVAVITIEGPIDAITSMSVQRRIRVAEQAGADALVIELDTPGGEVGAVLEICSAIENSSIRNTVAWVHNQAYSGGAIVALSCREIVVSRSASFGDAKVVGFSPFEGMIEPDDVQKEKIYPVLFERIDAFTKRHNEAVGRYSRDELLSQAIIADDAELWWVRDKNTGTEFAIDRAEFERLFPDAPVLQPALADANVGSVVPERPLQEPRSEVEERPSDAPARDFTPVSPDVERFQTQIEEQIAISDSRQSLRPAIDFNDPGRYELQAKLLSGRGAVVIGSDDMARYGFAANIDASGTRAVPITNDAELKAFFLAQNLERLDANWSESLVRVMSTLPVKGLLVIVFLLGLFIEMTNPGLVAPGAVAFLALLGLIIPPYIIGAAGWWAIAAILGGILLLLLEIFVFPGFGVPGALGLLCLFGGLLGLFIGDTSPQFPGGPPTRNQTDVLYSVAALLLSSGVSVGGMFVIVKNFGRLPVISRLILRSEHDPDQPTLLSAMAARAPLVAVGTTGTTLTVLRPSGRIIPDTDDPRAGDPIDVVSATGYIDADVRVRVVESAGFRIVVEPLDPS